MDDLVISGKRYISSKRASEITGYAKDYIGQLARAGKIGAKRVGRAWYVDESDLMRHVGTEEGPAVHSLPVSLGSSPAKMPHHLNIAASLPKTWSEVRYMNDDSELFPPIAVREISESRETPKIKREIAAHAIQHASLVRPNSERQARLDVLVDGIRPKSAVMRVGKPVEPHKTLHNDVSIHIPVSGGLAIAGVALVLVFGLTGLMWVSKAAKSHMDSSEATAASYFGISDIVDSLNLGELVQGGISVLSAFFGALAASFFQFLKMGIDFLLGLMNLV